MTGSISPVLELDDEALEMLKRLPRNEDGVVNLGPVLEQIGSKGDAWLDVDGATPAN